MGPIRFLKALRRNERGNVLIVGAATLPMMMGAAGLAIDTVQLALWKRQLQRAADSAALAGGHALVQGASTNQAVANDLDEHIEFDIGKNETPELTGTMVQSGSFAAGTISAQSCAVRAIAPCYDRAVRVALQTQRQLPFMHIFTGAPNTIEANGTAAVTESGEFCMISLYNGNSPGIIAGGNANLDLSCGIATNARASSNAINIFGNATVTATPLAAVGGIDPGKNTYTAQILQPYSTPVVDPYAGLPDPVAPANCNTSLTIGNNATQDIPAGSCFTSWDVKGHARLAAGGTYYVKNGTLDINGQVSGTNVTIILIGDGSNLVQNGGGVLNVTAPTTGTYQGIALYRSRFAGNDVNKPIKINGGAELQVKGAIYMPSTDIWVGGNADFNAQCLQVVGRIIEFKGGGSVANDCSDSGSKAFRQPLVRLVG